MKSGQRAGEAALASQSETPEQDREATVWWPAIGVHVGMLLVCVSCAWTLQPGWLTPKHLVSYGVVGLALLAMAAATRGRFAATSYGALLLMVGAATAFFLAYDPLLSSLPALGALGSGAMAQFEAGLAHPGVVIAGAFGLVGSLLAPRVGTDDRATDGFGRATALSLGLVLLLTGAIHFALSGIYDLSGATTSNVLLVYRAMMYTALMLVAWSTSGKAGYGSAVHIYVGLAIIGSVVRSILA